MIFVRAFVVLMLLAGMMGAARADDISETIELARKSYQSGDLANAKQSLDLASQLIGQKNAEGFAALLPNPLPGWKADRAQSAAMGAVMFGASVASRSYSNSKGDNVEVQITGDSAMVMQFATLAEQSADRRRHGQAHSRGQPARHPNRGRRRQHGDRQQVPGHRAGLGLGRRQGSPMRRRSTSSS